MDAFIVMIYSVLQREIGRVCIVNIFRVGIYGRPNTCCTLPKQTWFYTFFHARTEISQLREMTSRN